jgi:integration host factor subunit alpha
VIATLALGDDNPAIFFQYGSGYFDKFWHGVLIPGWFERDLSRSQLIVNSLTQNRIFANVYQPHLSFPALQLRSIRMALTKKDIVDQVQEQLGFPKNQSVDITESLLELIKSSLESGDDVLVSGFGKFCVKEKNERKGRNPATGNDMMLPARRVVTFKCSGKLREKINS